VAVLAPRPHGEWEGEGVRPHLRITGAATFFFAAALVLCPLARAAESPEQQLKSIEKRLDESREKAAQFADQAATLSAEIARLREESIAAAKAAQEHERVLSSLEDQLAVLDDEEARKLAEIKRRRAQQRDLLMALERLARNPPEGLALAPGDPLDAVHSAILMGSAVPRLETEARQLRIDIATLNDLRRRIADAREHHRAERLDLEQDQTRLVALIARKAALQDLAQQGIDEMRQRQLQLAAQASDLQQLIQRLESEHKQREAEAQRRREEAARRAEAQRLAHRTPHPEPRDAAPASPDDPSKPAVMRPFAKAKGTLIVPASGPLLRRFGEADEVGATNKGLIFETREGAQVVAPFDGRVLFAGPFRGYGQILIIEHGDGYHSLLAGLDRVEGTVGQWLVAGEPVGTMPAGEKKPHLYLELRHDGQPINPLPWLATHDEKVSG
jgi:murein hydrolase activator